MCVVADFSTVRNSEPIQTQLKKKFTFQPKNDLCPENTGLETSDFSHDSPPANSRLGVHGGGFEAFCASVDSFLHFLNDDDNDNDVGFPFPVPQQLVVGPTGFLSRCEPAPTLAVDGRSLSEYCDGLFDFVSEDKEVDVEAEAAADAALINEFGNFFEPNFVDQRKRQKLTLIQPVNESKVERPSRFVIPSIPSLAIPTTSSIDPQTNDNDNDNKTKQERKKQYRKEIAIPRYLRKRQNRKWTKEIIHPSRSLAAYRRPRKGGQFDVVDARFTPCISNP